MQWSLLIAVPDYVAFPSREYLRVRQFTQIMSAFPRSLFVQHRKWLIPEAADSQKFGMEVKVLFFPGYIYVVVRDDSPLPRDLCFVSTAGAKCACVSARQNHLPAVIHDVSARTSTLRSPLWHNSAVMWTTGVFHFLKSLLFLCATAIFLCGNIQYISTVEIQQLINVNLTD